MRLVHVEAGVEGVAELAQARERCEIAVHREDRVSHHPCAPSCAPMLDEELLEVFALGVTVDVYGGAAQSEAIDQARVVEAIAESDVARSEERRERPDVRGIAAG